MPESRLTCLVVMVFFEGWGFCEVIKNAKNRKVRVRGLFLENMRLSQRLGVRGVVALES